MFIGEIKQLPYSKTIRGLLPCDGRALNIVDYPLLFSVIGTLYGGDGLNTFALPNLINRTPLHAGLGAGLTTKPLGSSGGESTVALAYAQMANHGHSINVRVITTNPSMTNNATDNFIGFSKTDAQAAMLRFTNTTGTGITLDERTIESTGEGAPHSNMQPSIGVYYYISTVGEYPVSDVG